MVSQGKHMPNTAHEIDSCDYKIRENDFRQVSRLDEYASYIDFNAA